MNVKFHKSCKGICKYINLDKYYNVIYEYKESITIVDETGEEHNYPKAWISERCD